ncbi:SHOCT domain-containing protein [Nocardioides sp. Iso805N]|uniref:SHOCT domain-containing protein n=1 Tax=Nocardioides sp. Iso805N TaxID=1283287 RepID=UPI000377FEC3|nr:SHOCT domain-containing protein [Nocardioides sp. Iso805N]
MGLLFRPRRPLLRLAAGATTAGVAYHMGRQRAEQNAYNDQAAAAYAATQPPPAAASPPTAGDPTLERLERLSQLHSAGELSDTEFAAAKAKLLGL